jgi:hypothetical protein
MRNHCKVLLKAGLSGVYQFPLVVPLFSLSASLDDNKLKQIARIIKKSAGKKKIAVTNFSNTVFPAGKDDTVLFGYHLDLIHSLEISDNAVFGITRHLTPAVAGTFLISGNHINESQKRILQETPCEKFEFRAAAVANMTWQPFTTGSDTGYKWNIGRLFWLPKKYQEPNSLTNNVLREGT